MEGIFCFYGWARFFGILLSSILLAYELGTPGHGFVELLSIGLYAASLIEAANHASHIKE